MRRIGIGQPFMSRLARDVRGNTIALTAAAMMPLAGLVGGGVDMSRLYLTKTRLQQACDAGALAGRKAMGGGGWTTGSGSTNARAESMFTGNFLAGAYGTGTLTRGFTESNGVVTGRASVVVPMTIMKIFGMISRSVSVTCTAKMEIPNTDVMFVLDTTGSMECAPGELSCWSSAANGSRKIDGLRSAVLCFYEALMKVNTAQVCGNDPTATVASTTAQIRIGFVPYAVNVNVGKLLLQNHIANNWSYQSREAAVGTNYAWTLGTETTITGWGAWSAAPTDLQQSATYSGWSTVSANNTTISGTSYPKYRTANNSSTCTSPNSTSGGIGYSDVGTVDAATQGTASPPVYPATQQTLNYTQDDDHTVTAYKYVWNNSWSSNKCRLQSATRTYTLTRSGGQSTRSVSWTAYPNSILNWTYRLRELNVAALKGANGAWQNTVSLPIGETTGATNVNLSGSSSSTTIKYLANVDVDWDGCIEERQTYQNTDTVTSDDWNPIPSSAFDMNIDMLPSDTAGTRWGPMLEDAVWGRYSSSSCNWGGCTYTRSFNNIVTLATLDHNANYSCPSEARRLTSYPTATNFVNYVNGLQTGGATYHDIGMLWGARLISPTGIFAADNALTPAGRSIQRHIIFMTDGATNTADSDYTAHGIRYYDRRQTSYAPSKAQLDSLTDARLAALCTAIKNMNITLWVVSYGSAVDTATQTRLSTCATTNRFFAAADTTTLISRFRQIASEISELRLTS